MNRFPALALVAILTLTLACGDDPLTVEGLAGQYTLVRADGRSLPATVLSSDTLTVEVTGGSLLLLENGEYSLSADLRFSDPQSPGSPTTDTFIDVGPWEIEGDFVLFASTTPGKIWLGTLDGRAIEIELSLAELLDQIVVLTYRR